MNEKLTPQQNTPRLGPRLAALGLAAAVFLALPAGAQEYYQWEDADGTTNFGDNPPGDAINVKKFTREGRPSNRARQDRARINEEAEGLTKDLGERDRAEDTEDQIDTAKELLAKQRELDKARCDTLRRNLNTYNTGGRVFDTNPETGERTYISDDQIAARRARAEEALRKDCR